MKKYLKIFGVLLLSIGLLAIVSACTNQTVATVNGETISRQELDERLTQKAGKQILDQLITEKLILQAGEKAKIKISDKQVNDRITEIKKQFPDQKSFDKNLKDNNLTLKDAKEQIRIQLISQKMLEKSTKVTDKEVEDYYTQNKDSIFNGKKLTEVKDDIKNQLSQQKQYGNAQTWIESLKKKAKIKIDL